MPTEGRSLAHQVRAPPRVGARRHGPDRLGLSREYLCSFLTVILCLYYYHFRLTCITRV